MLKRILKYLGLTLLALLIIAQFFPIDKTNPPSDPAQDFLAITNPPPHLATIIKDACYDCHSHHTKYPWYANIAPVSWWMQGHIDHGRGELNFSEWTSYPANKADHKLEECVEMCEKHWMPILSYKITHPEGRLSDEQYTELAAWFEKTRKAINGDAEKQNPGKE